MTRWRVADRVLSFPPPLAAGIVNVTADSFYEGARSVTPERAVADGLALAEAGFDLLDVGSVAARSGPAVSPDEEAARLIPAVEELARRAGVPVSADTFQPRVARLALEAGAAAINDISGGADPEMLELVAERGCGYVLMHIEGPPRVDREPPAHRDPVVHLKRWFQERVQAALRHGVAEEQIALDPGLDFDLSVDDDLEILRRLGELRELGRPLFVALSRKDFLGAVLAGSWEGRAAATQREWATAAATALAVAQGAEMVRLHDRSALDALRTAAAISAQPADHGLCSTTTEPSAASGA
jgi:dihydropteroate synthase